jgi:predicted AAA+ superfamily ATPase
MPYKQRIIESKLRDYLKIFPVVAITGPRQSGKSTLLQHCLPDYQYVTFDDYRSQEFLARDPEGFFQRYASKTIFDEVQKVPDIFNHIKLRVDRDRANYGNFILTGSSQFSLVQNITESLAGRIGLLTLLPFQISEMASTERDDAIFRGSYPELVERHFNSSDEWYGSYLDTYVNKDVRSISNIGDLREFQRLIRLLAARTSQQLEISSFAKDLGVAVSTITRWISVLEASYIIFLLPPYFKNYGKRITKSPKLYFYDTGLVSYLTGIKNRDLYENGPLTGGLFENYVVGEILKRELHLKTNSSLYYFRTSHGVEVDLIIDRGLHKDLIEIKHSSTFHPKMADSISTIMESGDRAYLLYNGENFPYVDEIKILNYKNYLLRERE